jgi:hypothetical protein
MHPTTAPLPAQAQSGLAARISNPGLASRIDAHPGVDCFDDPPGDFANDVPAPDISMPPGWEHNPNWDSDMSIWEQMKGPGDATKAYSMKHKKWAHHNEHQSYGILAIHEEVTREYLVRLSAKTVDDEALATELRSARQAYALQQAEQARTMVLPTPQFVELPLQTRYKGEGEPLPHGDPPIPVTGCLPHPLSRLVPRMAEWYDICP